jgi:exoribonuclease-2
VRVTGFDLLTLDVHAQLLARLDDVPISDVNPDVEETEDAPPSVTVNLAIDLQDSTQAPSDSSVTAT